MLFEEVEYIGKNVSKKYFNLFISLLIFLVEFINVLYDVVLVWDVRFILDVLCVFDNVVEYIFKCCVYLNDCYELERGGIGWIMVYWEYYCVENVIFCFVISDCEYVEYVVKYN